MRKSDAVITYRLESTFRPPSLNELCVTLFMLTAYIESAFPTIKYFICMFIWLPNIGIGLNIQGGIRGQRPFNMYKS